MKRQKERQAMTIEVDDLDEAQRVIDELKAKRGKKSETCDEQAKALFEYIAEIYRLESNMYDESFKILEYDADPDKHTPELVTQTLREAHRQFYIGLQLFRGAAFEIAAMPRRKK